MSHHACAQSPGAPGDGDEQTTSVLRRHGVRNWTVACSVAASGGIAWVVRLPKAQQKPENEQEYEPKRAGTVELIPVRTPDDQEE